MDNEYPVDVKAVFGTDGTVIPISLLWKRRELKIKILDAQKGVSLKDSGMGMRYKIFAGRRISFLYRFADLWYMAFAQEDMRIPSIQNRHWLEGESFMRIIDERYNSPHKEVVEVEALFSHIRGVVPLSFKWADGHEFLIDGSSDPRPEANIAAGIGGICYDIAVLGHDTQIYRDDDAWYMARKGMGVFLDVHGRPIGREVS